MDKDNDKQEKGRQRIFRHRHSVVEEFHKAAHYFTCQLIESLNRLCDAQLVINSQEEQQYLHLQHQRAAADTKRWDEIDFPFTFKNLNRDWWQPKPLWGVQVRGIAGQPIGWHAPQSADIFVFGLRQVGAILCYRQFKIPASISLPPPSRCPLRRTWDNSAADKLMEEMRHAITEQILIQMSYGRPGRLFPFKDIRAPRWEP